MNIKIPQYNVTSADNCNWVSADPDDAKQRFFSAVQREITSKFLYEPMNDRTLDMIRENVVYEMRNKCGGVFASKVDIDDMHDLKYRQNECKACAETSSYEEYRIKRAARNLPDDAGSEKNWLRMSQYKPGSVNVNIDFIPLGQSAQEIEYTVKLC